MAATRPTARRPHSHTTRSSRTSHSSRSRVHKSRSRRTAARAVRTLTAFFGLDRRRIEQERLVARQARRLARRQLREEREFQHAVAAGRDGTGQTAADIRRQAREAFERRSRLPDGQIYLLAALEGAHIDRPGHRKRLRHGLVVRLMRYDNAYYFLANTGYYYRSAHKYGHNDDLDFVVDTWVPITVKMFAQPYRQMCRR